MSIRCPTPAIRRLLATGTIFLSAFTATAADRNQMITVGDLRNDDGFYSVVFYYSPKPVHAPEATARSLAIRHLPRVTFSADTQRNVAAPVVGFEEESAPLRRFPVPPASYFVHAGRGITTNLIAEFSRTVTATRLVLVAPKAEVFRLGRAFTRLVGEFAATNSAVIWDSSTRECFSRSAWQTNREQAWGDRQIPDLSRQITIHLYQPDPKVAYLRAITLGMEKFALPDVVVEQLIPSENRPVGNLINAVCQSFAERPEIENPSEVKVRTREIQSPEARKRAKAGLLKGATEAATLALVVGTAQDGDPDNPLVELDFRHGQGTSNDERRQQVLSEMWGSEDAITGASHSADLLAASARARDRLNSLRKDFLEGLPPGSRFLVKGPFKRDDEGDEWMWVEVLKWESPERIDGVLQNDPFYIRKLRAGARVSVRTDAAFDYLWVKPDGTSEGNETGRLIEKQAGPTIRK